MIFLLSSNASTSGFVRVRSTLKYLYRIIIEDDIDEKTVHKRSRFAQSYCVKKMAWKNMRSMRNRVFWFISIHAYVGSDELLCVSGTFFFRVFFFFLLFYDDKIYIQRIFKIQIIIFRDNISFLYTHSDNKIFYIYKEKLSKS